MARELTTDKQIEEYVRALVEYASHNAPHVASIITPLAAAVRCRLAPGRDRLEVYTRNGNLARSCWVTLCGYRYALSYNYDKRMIDLREGGLQGAVLFQFDNDTSSTEIRRRIDSLCPG